MTDAADLDEPIGLGDLSEEQIRDLDGITVDEDGTPRFTMYVVDNAGVGPHEE
jgi:hypothetical protein